MIVVDTHALLWWASAPTQLSKRARAVIDGADTVGVPAIVFWELALLTRRARVSIDRPVSDWATTLLTVPRVAELPITAPIAIRADSLDMHQDPTDRLIVATALEHGTPIVSKDKLLRRLRSVECVW